MQRSRVACELGVVDYVNQGGGSQDLHAFAESDQTRLNKTLMNEFVLL